MPSWVGDTGGLLFCFHGSCDTIYRIRPFDARAKTKETPKLTSVARWETRGPRDVTARPPLAFTHRAASDEKILWRHFSLSLL